MLESRAGVEPPPGALAGRFLRNEPLACHGNWEIGGPADYLVEPASAAHLRETLRWAAQAALPLAIIGDGTNLLFPDEGFRGVVVKIGRRLGDFRIEGMTIETDAGAWVPTLARAAGKAGIGGMEHTVGIPGTIGGLVLMNGGSQRKSIGTMVREVRTMDRAGNERVFPPADCMFGYRTSALQDSGLIVTHVRLEGLPRAPWDIRHEMIDIMHKRRAKFPKQFPNCGSVFVSHPGMFDKHGPPGRVIEETGLKGTRIGGALIPQLHANFIVNAGGATAADVIECVRLVREKVHARTGFWMLCEVRYLCPDGTIRPLHEVL